MQIQSRPSALPAQTTDLISALVEAGLPNDYRERIASVTINADYTVTVVCFDYDAVPSLVMLDKSGAVMFTMTEKQPKLTTHTLDFDTDAIVVRA